MSTSEVLQLTVLSPQAILYSGPARSVSSKNSAGNFDILGQHANFITIVENQSIDIKDLQNKKTTFKFPIAIIYACNNIVKVYAQLPTAEIE